MVFVNSMSDLFQDGVPDEYIITVAHVMAIAKWHTFQVLTKRPQRMRELLSDKLLFAARAPHIWWGVSVEDKQYGVPRIAQLRTAPAQVRFLSIEPLLEDLGQVDLTGIHWVIVGGESGPGARPMQQVWVESIRDQCAAARIPFFFKQWGGVQKSKTGRILNGRTYDEQPPRSSVPVPEPIRRFAFIQDLERTVASWRSTIVGNRSGSKTRRSRGVQNAPAARRVEEEGPYLFEMPEQTTPEPQIAPLTEPIWTENKARLIERYLYYFVLVTKHGTYIDGFAGPQWLDKPDMWAAKLVLESEPRWFRHFHLFDREKGKVDHLHALRNLYPERDIHVYQGDFNSLLPDLLQSGKITQREATFCLLDQITFECHWATLQALAQYKTVGHKIELFYFLPNSWLLRALKQQRDIQVLKNWWGRDDWETWGSLSREERARSFAARFKQELGYRSVKPWPIYERRDGGNIMYYMIHATDHPAAPELMARAYRQAVKPKESYEQLQMEFKSLAIEIELAPC
jgi:three-Cys-motif partner protein